MIKENLNEKLLNVSMVSEDGTNYLQMLIHVSIGKSEFQIHSDDIKYGENCDIQEFADAMFEYISSKLDENIKRIRVVLLKEDKHYELDKSALEKNGFIIQRDNLHSIVMYKHV